MGCVTKAKFNFQQVSLPWRNYRVWEKQWVAWSLIYLISSPGPCIALGKSIASTSHTSKLLHYALYRLRNSLHCKEIPLEKLLGTAQTAQETQSEIHLFLGEISIPDMLLGTIRKYCFLNCISWKQCFFLESFWILNTPKYTQTQTACKNQDRISQQFIREGDEC